VNGSFALDVLRPFTLKRSACPLGALLCGGGRKAGAAVVLVPATVLVVVPGLREVVLPASGAAFVVVDVVVLVGVLVLVEVLLLIVLVVLVDVVVLIVLVDVLWGSSVVPWQ
jgi:hypothetical protein